MNSFRAGGPIRTSVLIPVRVFLGSRINGGPETGEISARIPSLTSASRGSPGSRSCFFRAGSGRPRASQLLARRSPGIHRESRSALAAKPDVSTARSALIRVSLLNPMESSASQVVAFHSAIRIGTSHERSPAGLIPPPDSFDTSADDDTPARGRFSKFLTNPMSNPNAFGSQQG